MTRLRGERKLLKVRVCGEKGKERFREKRGDIGRRRP